MLKVILSINCVNSQNSSMIPKRLVMSYVRRTFFNTNIFIVYSNARVTAKQLGGPTLV